MEYVGYGVLILIIIGFVLEPFFPVNKKSIYEGKNGEM